jgi:transcriptional regulator with XRE-family HTH domain
MRIEKIKNLAKNRGITLKDLAVKIDMSEANLYRVFKRQSIETKYLESIADVLQVPVGYFFGEIQEDGKKIVQSGENNLVGSNQNIINSNAVKELEECRKEVAYLKEQVKDKEKLIKLLESK